MCAQNRNLHAINFYTKKYKKITTVQGMRKTFLLHAVLFCNHQLSICIQLLPKVIKKIAQRKQKWKRTQIMISPSGQVKHYYKRKFKVAPKCLQMATPPHMLEHQRTGRISSQVTRNIASKHVHQRKLLFGYLNGMRRGAMYLFSKGTQNKRSPWKYRNAGMLLT